ncbi:MAG: site-specific integrase [Synechococcales bacterium]|nr:site-specific integrase [Synechococcales bacterium]
MPEQNPIDTRIQSVNQRLKAAQLGLQLERRGNKLSLRGTLPPRPDRHRLKPHQQRLSLGLPATPAGVKQAEQQAKIIAAQLIQRTFDWRDYLPLAGGQRLCEMDVAQKIDAFRQDFFNQPQRQDAPASALANWETAYLPYLRKLEAIAQTSPHLDLVEAIYKTIEAIPAHTRSRQVCCTALGALATFLRLDLPTDLKTYWGTYNASRARPRQLPTDEEIVAVYHTIPHPAWRFVYGVMATYGLRNHEVFFSDYSQLQQGHPAATVNVLETTKTGDREVWPFYPEWVQQFQLTEVTLPNLTTDLEQTTLQRIGQKVSSQLRRYGLPFSPYNLRHAWAVRTIHFGLPDTIAAQMMGHSVAIHTRTYHRWLTRRDQQQAVETALSRHPPQAPSAFQGQSPFE